MKRRLALVADLGGTKIAAARVDDTGRITHRLSVPTPPAGGLAVLMRSPRLLRRLPVKGAAGSGWTSRAWPIRMGGLGAEYPGWERMPLAGCCASGCIAGRCRERPQCLRHRRGMEGSAKGCSDVVFVMIGTGIGAGIISGGRLIRGYGELSGCAGWMAVRDRFRRGYASVGCLESHAAGPGIARAAVRIFHNRSRRGRL